MTRKLGLVLLVQVFALVAAVFGQLSATLTGRTITLAAEPADPIDPFRGAYVALRYPDLPDQTYDGTNGEETVYVSLAPSSNGPWQVTGHSTVRPSKGVYLTCQARYTTSCGIESYFLPEAKAASFNTRGKYLATIKVDRWGHTHLVKVVPAP